ncbi:carbohydrate binding domain-containing protein [uncultured Dokdonia sp.]|uniref:carbohydrate binding domain-containing protein n=1 Tax=uncultured Dokdonia sp. TaxID=575653 RepID=UPI00261ACF90|nr:carbohydrate binding domain-containing protein [uncultured Dokdonia sp.]
MKKITFLLFMFFGAIALQAQENLLSNGDFEQGMVTWFGNAFNVQEDGGNSFNLSDNEVSGNPFDVNLSHPVALTAGLTYTLSFDASTSMEDVSRTIIAGIGLNEGDFSAAVETVTVTSDTQTYTLELTPPAGSMNSRALFDLGADDGVLVIDNVVLTVEETMNEDNLLSNGDFEEGMTVWEGNGFNVQTDGGNSFNFVDVATAGDPFAVNLSQRGINIAEGQTFTLTFDASTDATTASRTMIAGIGLFVDPFTNQSQEITVTEATQTFTLELTANFSSADSRVLFDMGAAEGIVVIDNVVLTLNEEMNNGDELLSNGDFEQGMVTWFGNAFNVQEDGGNSFNLSDNEVSGNPFDVNLSHPVALEGGVAYTFSFDASTSMEDGSRTIIAGIGLNEGDFSAATEVVTVTSDLQTYTFTLTPPAGSANSRVLFDLGADDGVLVLDNVSLMLAEGGGDPEIPMVAAPTPPNRAEDAVFSIFSNAYNNQPNVVFGAFGVGTQDITTIQIEGDDTQQVVATQPDPQFLLVDWGTIVDNTAMTHFHMDYWISTDLATGLIANPALSNHVGDAGETSVFGLTNPVNTFGEWVSVDVPLADFDFGDNTQQRDALRQFVLTVAGADNGARTIFLDNIYLHNNTTEEEEDPEMPLVAAPTPPNRAEDAVFSIFSNAYTNQPDVVFGAFGVGTQDITTIQIEGDDTQQVVATQPDPQFLLVDWGTIVDNTAMTHFHMDYWISTDLSTGLIANPALSNHVGDAGETSVFGLTNPVNTFGEWVSVDVPLVDFDFGDNTQQRDALRQFVLTVAGADNGARTIFLDNIYLHNNTTLSTEEFTAVDISVYPNPSSDRWTVSTSTDIITSVAVYDLLGRRVSVATPNANAFDIDASNLRTGIYLATVTTNQGQETIKLIKR